MLSLSPVDVVGDDNFNAEAFFADLTHGKYDGRLHEELLKLTHQQLEEVVALITKHLTNHFQNTRGQHR